MKFEISSVFTDPKILRELREQASGSCALNQIPRGLSMIRNPWYLTILKNQWYLTYDLNTLTRGMMSGFWRFRFNARIWWFQWVLYFIPVEYIVCPATHNNIKAVCELPVLIQSRNPSEIGRNSSLKDTVLGHFSNLLRLYLGAQTIFSSMVSIESYYRGLEKKTVHWLFDLTFSLLVRFRNPLEGFKCVCARCLCAKIIGFRPLTTENERKRNKNHVLRWCQIADSVVWHNVEFGQMNTVTKHRQYMFWMDSCRISIQLQM